jgi:glycosyltransferase involved in cell wall biosynthesis
MSAAGNIKNQDLVSIGVPVYNGEKFLAQALDSVLNQTYQNWECNIINNSSTDGTEKIAQEYVTKDSRFRLFTYKEFLPIVQNWNRTVLHISENARYYKILQADDWIDNTFLEEMIRVMERYPTVGVCSSYRIDGRTIKCDGLDINDGQFYPGKDMLFKHLKEEVDVSGSATTVLFKTDYLKKLPQYPEIHDVNDFHCDTQLVFDMMNISDLGFVFKVLSYTRWHPDAYTSQICVVCNTFYNGREIRLNKYKHLDPMLEKEYKKHRQDYAFYIIQHYLKRDMKCVKWHLDHLLRPFTFSEYLSAFLQQNIISRQFSKITKKFSTTTQ